MNNVLLIQQDEIPHYRVPVYNYLAEYLGRRGFKLMVASGRVQAGTPHALVFEFRQTKMTFSSLARLLVASRADVVIFFLGLKYLYLFPLILLTKILQRKVIYWGHGRDLLDADAILKNAAYSFQHWLSDAIILYAAHLKPLIRSRFHSKVFIANNTLNLTSSDGLPLRLEAIDTAKVLGKYGITTSKNILCIGRFEQRKRPDDLFQAFKRLEGYDYGLVLVGPDIDGSSQSIKGRNVHRLGPIYGQDRLELLQAADVFCLPGHLGLGIVDAFYCGLPVVTQAVEHAPEIMYLKDGVNGFIVPAGDIDALAAKLRLLLEDEGLRQAFSAAARAEIMTTGHISVMCRGFAEALEFVSESRSRAPRADAGAVT